MFYFFAKGKCTEVFQGIRDITPEIYCLIGKHLFSSVSTRTRFTEVLLRCIPCIVRMPITSIGKGYQTGLVEALYAINA